MKRLLAWLRSQSWLVWAGIASLLLFAAFLFYGWGKGTVYDLRGWLFEREQAATTERERELEKRTNAAIRRAEIAEAQAASKDAEIKALKGLIAENGGKIVAEQKRLEQELERIRRESGNCAELTDQQARVDCVCLKLERAGFSCD